MLIDGPTPYFARLVFIFTYQVGDQELALAMIQPFELVRPSDQETALELLHFRISAQGQSRFVPARSILRGALMSSASRNSNSYYLVDVVDTDWFLRVRQLFPQRFPK